MTWILRVAITRRRATVYRVIGWACNYLIIAKVEYFCAVEIRWLLFLSSKNSHHTDIVFRICRSEYFKFSEFWWSESIKEMFKGSFEFDWASSNQLNEFSTTKCCLRIIITVKEVKLNVIKVDKKIFFDAVRTKLKYQRETKTPKPLESWGTENVISVLIFSHFYIYSVFEVGSDSIYFSLEHTKCTIYNQIDTRWLWRWRLYTDRINRKI